MSAPPSDRPSPPEDRDEALQLAGARARATYDFVRDSLDDLERAAPWTLLYYPPEEDEKFLHLCAALRERIQAMPKGLEELTERLLEDRTDSAARQAVEDARFYFDGILMMTGWEMSKLEERLTQFGDGGTRMSPEDRTEMLEITADLKGKYTSSIMGAAASLIAEDRWNGVELEPILFPEKRDEFERNELLVETLREVLGAIDSLRREVPLPALAETWKARRKVDQYALTPLYAFLGNLGKLMKESSRRALYSGDYHQIRKRESQLSTRVNELNTFHNQTWGTVPLPLGATIEDAYAQLEAKAVEIAAILDLELLKKAIGDAGVKNLHAAVVTEKEKVRKVPDPEAREQLTERLRSRLPEDHRALVPLLYEEDLKAFLDLLLGSVMKRASLAAARDARAPAPARSRAGVGGGPPAEVLDIDPELLEPGPTRFEPVTEAPDLAFDAESDLEDDEPDGGGMEFGLPDDFGFDPLPDLDVPRAPLSEELPSPSAPPSRKPSEFVQQASDEDRSSALAELQTCLRSVMARGNSKRRPLELLNRLLQQGKNVPPGMVRSIHPFLDQVSEELQPRVRVATIVAGLPSAAADNLESTCRSLRRKPDPHEIHTTVASNVQRLVHLLEGLDSTVAAMLRKEKAPF